MGTWIDIRPHDPATAVVDATLARRVAPVVSFPAAPFGPAATGAVVGRRVTGCLGRRDGPAFRFPAKLAPRVGVALRRAGLDPVLRFGRLRVAGPAPAAVAAAPPAVRGLFAAPAAWAGGIVPPAPGLRPAAAVPAILRLYPGARAVVVAENRRLVRWWATRLRRAGLPQPVVTARDLNDDWDGGPKVAVVSLDALDRCRREDFDLAVVPDAGPLADVVGGREVPGRRGPRRTRDYALLRRLDVPAFGFLPPGREPGRGERLRLLAMFGRFLGPREPLPAARGR